MLSILRISRHFYKISYILYSRFFKNSPIPFSDFHNISYVKKIKSGNLLTKRNQDKRFFNDRKIRNIIGYKRQRDSSIKSNYWKFKEKKVIEISKQIINKFYIHFIHQICTPYPNLFLYFANIFTLPVWISPRRYRQISKNNGKLFFEIMLHLKSLTNCTRMTGNRITFESVKKQENIKCNFLLFRKEFYKKMLPDAGDER